MTDLHLRLPESLETFLAAEVALGGYENAGDYVLALLQHAKQAKQRAELETKLLAGIQSLERGDGREMTTADWDRLHARIGESEQA